uniref:Major facilitator superfamily (MFS) profile domain-containing protein n=1 Tax=Phlebotomus papatasi TaxID=29031 RepID=A0A1B0CZU9_PHLPP
MIKILDFACLCLITVHLHGPAVYQWRFIHGGIGRQLCPCSGIGIGKISHNSWYPQPLATVDYIHDNLRIAYVARDWRTIQLIGSIPCFLLLVLWLNVPESPRWLLARGRTEELKEIINRIAARNKITLPDNYEKLLISPSDTDTTVSILDLFRGKLLRTTLLMTVIWFSLVLLYFGITLHMNNLGGNIYINTILAGAVEGIAIICSILVVLKLGIRINLVIYMLVAGLACLMVNFVPDGNLWMIITLVMIGKCTIGATNAIIQTFTAYQYPTMLRNLGVGAGNFAAGVALIVVPYLWLMDRIQVFLPMTIMGGFGIIGAIALMLLHDKSPKTKKQQRAIVRF